MTQNQFRNRISSPSACVVGLLSAALLWSAAPSWAGVGDIGIGGAFGAANPIGTERVRMRGSVGHAIGAHVGYDVAEHFNAELSYDNLYLGKGMRIEPIILSGVWHKELHKHVEPFLQLGAGIGRGVEGKGFDNFAGKAGVGLIFHPFESLSAGPQVIYHYVGDQGSARNSAHTVTPGVFFTYAFKLIQTQS